MKKLLALLMACATMTCAFASCGDDESSESSASESSVAETTESTTEEVTTEATTEEETTQAETSESEEDTDVSDGEDTSVTAETEFTTHEYLADADKTPFIGKWQGEKIEFDGETATDVMGIPVSVLYQYEFKDDGTLALGESLIEISGDTSEYTWGIISDTEIEIVNTAMQVAVVMELDGDYLVSNADGQKAYLAKVDDFTPFDMESFMNGSGTDDASGDTSVTEDVVTDAETEEVSGTSDTDTINE